MHAAREMLFGSRDEFEYLECARCGCLQLIAPPDLAKYYPKNYYSYLVAQPTIETTNGGGFKQLKKRFITNQITSHYFNGNTRLGKWLEGRSSLAGDYVNWPWLTRNRLDLKLNLRSRVLDVGCGSGQLLQDLRALGFSNLLGADPFIEEDIRYDEGLSIVKKSVAELDEQFDFIMLNHSFEHMPQPLEVLNKLRGLLKTEKYLLIRIPIQGFAWRKYGVNWVGLDAPRHLFIHTLKSFRLLAEQAGFQIADVIFDSSEFQFWASEQYVEDIPLNDPKSFLLDPEGSIFSPQQIEAFKAQAVKLNEDHDGDQVCLYLRSI
jgi:SAM-dependent methyltransferase